MASDAEREVVVVDHTDDVAIQHYDVLDRGEWEGEFFADAHVTRFARRRDLQRIGQPHEIQRGRLHHWLFGTL